ncbi:MAG: hypothetical protein KGI97_01600 [Alphaproteobacteria bacterium]|nr:hypothetical protein [Alphaproteobacteria bacterium]
MTDQPQPETLADRALARLRKLASGNGLEPAAIALIEAQEDVFALAGVTEVMPFCDAHPSAYPGGVKGRDKKIVGSFAALQQAAAQHKKQFSENPDWLGEAARELQEHETKGWGLESARVELPDKGAVYAATEMCPRCQGRQTLTCTQCNGQGTVICTQCQGQGREPCYYCGGRGEDPQNPGQRCQTCNGTRVAPCRFCQMRGHLPCPTCQGRRGTPCTACQGTGRISQEVAVTCGAETHFKLDAKGLPSGLRRGLDRVGIANLGKGHADIAATPPAKDEDGDGTPDKPPFPILTYSVKLPYAELRLGIGGKKAVISVFGKRCALMGVPNFLDASLKPWRDKLTAAAHGQGALEDALGARAMREILAMTIAGKGSMEELRKIYPFALSNEAAQGMLADVRQALNRVTLKTRAAIAVICVLLCAAGFDQFLTTGGAARITQAFLPAVGFAICFSTLALALGASWAVLNFSARFVLRKRFPQLRLGLQQKIGKTGAAMMAAIVAVFVLLLMLAPVKPLWLALLLR